MTGLGHNIDPFADVELLVQTLRKNPAPLCVVQNNLQIAERLRREFPSMMVIYRITTADNPDDNAQDIFTPESYLNRSIGMGSFAEAARLGCWIYVNNEPRWSDSLEWCRQVGLLIVKRGWKGALGNWSVGVPEPEQIGEAAELMRILHLYRESLIATFHAYFPFGLPTYDALGTQLIPYQEWPGVAPEDSHLLGRDRRFVKFARALGYDIRVGLSEFGSDTVHAAEDMRVVAWAKSTDRFGWQLAKVRYPAWHNLGLPDSETLYAKGLSWAWRVFYQPYREYVGAAHFCFGRTGDWRYYDISDNPYLLDLIAQEDFKVSSGNTHRIEAEGGALVKARVVMADTRTTLNVRTLPHTGAPVVDTLKHGDVIEYFEDSLARNMSGQVYEWRRIKNNRWIAMIPGMKLPKVNPDLEEAVTQLAVAEVAIAEAKRIIAAQVEN
jgi:hypothetical protein